jgi:hypothetical protein
MIDTSLNNVRKDKRPGRDSAGKPDSKDEGKPKPKK